MARPVNWSTGIEKMLYFYTSLWAATDEASLSLRGVIVADFDEIGVYFPDWPDEQQEWERLASGWKTWTASGYEATKYNEGFTPEAWLRGVAERGNALTEEFSEVSRVEATTLQEALHVAYERMLSDYGRKMPAYAPVVRGTSSDHSRPLADLLPDSLLYALPSGTTSTS